MIAHYRKKRIFIGLTEIAGYYHNLASGLRLLGYSVTFFTYNEHPFQYANENSGSFLRLIRFIISKKSKMTRWGLLQKTVWSLLARLSRIILLIWASVRHDIFIFGFGTSFFGFGLDYWLLKKFRKTIICNIGHGSDARPPYISGKYKPKHGCPYPISLMASHTIKMKNRIQKIENQSDYIICAHYSCHFLQKKFISFLQVGLPWYLDKKELIRKNNIENDSIRILHAPSNPAVKGTDLIRTTINRLKAKGHKIDFVEIIDRSHNDVLSELERCDFIVDQSYSDTPMAGLAMEAAWFGKPSVVGGYGLYKLRELCKKEMFPPTQICYPDELEAAIEQMILDVDYRKRLGERARSFVKSHWTTRQVAANFERIILGDVPVEWVVNPSDIVYLHGAGLDEEQLKPMVAKMIEHYGLGSLGLGHRPDLERAFSQFADSCVGDRVR